MEDAVAEEIQNSLDISDIIEDLAVGEDRQALEYLHGPVRRTRTVRHRPNNMDIWDRKQFFRRFRLEKETVLYLLSLIENKIKHKTQRNQCISPMDQLLLTLRFYATDSFYITIGDFGGLHNSTFCKIVKRVTIAICSLRSKFIFMPRNQHEIRQAQEKFYEIARFPRVIAAMDGTHIKITSPGGHTAEDYRNRKGFFSLNVQGLCTADLKFVDIVSRWAGSTHDSMIFQHSSLKFFCDRGAFPESVILGDSGYFSNNYLLIPLSNPQTASEHLYNESHIRTRNVIERCFGVWKRRFPVLSMGLRCKKELAQRIVLATAILHNLARSRNEAEPPIDPEVRIPSEPVTPPVRVPHNGAPPTTHSRQSFLQYFESLLGE